MSLISTGLIRRLSIGCFLAALLLLSNFSVAIAASDSEAEAGCPYANKKLGKAKCERFGDTSVLRFDTVGKPKAHVVCVHGLGLCAKAYIPFAERMAAAGYVELEHYYRPANLPREQQPWLASVWRRAAA